MVTYSNYIIFNVVTSTCGHQWSPAPTVYFCGHIYVIGTSRNGNLRRSLGGAKTLMFFVLFCFVFCFCFFRVILNKD